MNAIRKYPRTRHLAGSKLQPGDEDLDAVPMSALAGRHVVIEEKMDGANSGMSFSADGEFLLQSRGHYLTGGPRESNRIPATLLEKVPRDADLFRKEAFGPVALIEPFDDFDDAIAAVNDSDFGLQAGVFTGRLDHAMRAWDRLDVGGVIVGDVPSFRVDNMPYGGVKDSGLGREGVRYAIEDMTEQRLLVIRDPVA